MLLGAGAEDTLASPMADDLRRAGYRVLSLDLPCHGADAKPDDWSLPCWRRRIEHGEPLFKDFLRRARALLDTTGPLPVVGLSRGGYAAFLLAAADKRAQRVVAIAPVTDLSRLQEFAGVTVPAQYRLPAVRQPVSLVVGMDDQRIGTDAALRYAGRMRATVYILPVAGHDASAVRVHDFLTPNR